MGWGGVVYEDETLPFSYLVVVRLPFTCKPAQLARSSDGLTGAEIEAVFLEAMFSAFERSKEPADLDVASALNGFVPLSRLMAEQFAALKNWSINRARPATSHPTASEPTTRKLGV